MKSINLKDRLRSKLKSTNSLSNYKRKHSNSSNPSRITQFDSHKQGAAGQVLNSAHFRLIIGSLNSQLASGSLFLSWRIITWSIRPSNLISTNQNSVSLSYQLQRRISQKIKMPTKVTCALLKRKESWKYPRYKSWKKLSPPKCPNTLKR